MLDPDDIETAGDIIASIYSRMEAEILDHLVEMLIGVDELGQKSLTELNLIAQSATADLKRTIGYSKNSISDAVYETCETYLKASDADDMKRLHGGEPIWPRQIEATVIGMQKVLDRDNIGMVESAKDAFLKASMEAVTNVNSGLYTTEKALHKAVRKLERDGISLISYRNTKTGVQTVQNKVDVAVRRHIRTQISQDGARMTMERMQKYDVALVEVSSHAGSRPEHAEWQGRVYSLKGDITIEGTRYRDFYSATRYGSVDGLCGANCRHSFAPYIHGAPRSYEPNPDHPSGLSNDEVYDLTQKQRYLERKIREDKRDLRGAQLLYEDNPSLENQVNLIKAQDQLKKRQAGMRDFIKEANSKGKVDILQRSPRREWTGDMPKGITFNKSGQSIKEFVNTKSVQARIKAAGTSATRVQAEISAKMTELNLKPSDFSKIPKAKRKGILDSVFDAIDPIRPSTKKAMAGKHVRKTTFTPAKTIAEAEEYARKHFEATANYKGISLKAANGLNESIAEHIEQFPKLKDQINYIGSEQERNKVAKSFLTNWHYKENKAKWQSMGWTEQDMRKEAKRKANKDMGRIGNELAQSMTTSNPNGRFKDFIGITLNEKHFNEQQLPLTIKRMEYDASKKSKYHPINTGTPKGTYDHEAGHQLDHLLGISKDKEFLRYIKQLSSDDIIENLSKYAAPTKGRSIEEDYAEFIAEAWSEYQNNPNPRKHASFIGKLILKRYSELR